MSARRAPLMKTQVRAAQRRNIAVASRDAGRDHPKSRRSNVGHRSLREPFSPPETWHEPTEQKRQRYRVVVQPPGEGYRHVVTRQEIRQRLSELPAEFLTDLDVVQLSTVTRKKQSFPCYGMQWGSALYLYPLEESLTEHFPKQPNPTFFSEAEMYGGKWRQDGESWVLEWSERTVKDFYLNNILIHELGHLLDDRNSTYVDRERYAEWFAIHYGYRGSGGIEGRRPGRAIRRRHHNC